MGNITRALVKCYCSEISFILKRIHKEKKNKNAGQRRGIGGGGDEEDEGSSVSLDTKRSNAEQFVLWDY